MARLELVNAGSEGSRHYLEGKPVECGDALEIWREGLWRPVIYERSGEPHEFEAMANFSEDRVFAIRPDDDLRWPVRRRPMPRYIYGRFMLVAGGVIAGITILGKFLSAIPVNSVMAVALVCVVLALVAGRNAK